MTARDDEMRSKTMVAEDDLRALFEPHRPDPERFAAGVAERVAAAEDDQGGAGGETGRPWGLRLLLDRAAGVLPGLPDGGSLGKSWATILSLPVLLVIGLVVTFGRGLRLVDPERHRGASAPTERERWTHAMLPALLPTLASVLGLVLMGVYWLFGSAALVDAVTLVLLLAMLALTWHLGQVARSGVTDPVLTGRTVVMLLVATWLGCALWLQATRVFDGDSDLGHGAVGWIMALGIVASCLAVRAMTSLDAGLGLVLFLVVPLGAIWLPLPADTEARVRGHLEALYLEPEDLTNWQTADVMGRALAAVGVAPAELGPVRAKLAAAVDAGDEAAGRDPAESRDPVHPMVWTAAAAVDLLDAPQLRRVAQRGFTPRWMEGLLQQEGPLQVPTFNGFLLDCLLATRELSESQRAHLVRRIDASWPEPRAEGDALDQALLCVRWLDRLGLSDRVEAERDRLHALLAYRWVAADEAARFSYPGGFCIDPANGKHANIRATAAAVELIAHAGAPAEVKLRHVQAFLRSQLHTGIFGRLVGARVALPKQAEASLLLLRQGIGLPERGVLETVVGERAALGALLLVLLSLRAIWLARRSERRLVGAQP